MRGSLSLDQELSHMTVNPNKRERDWFGKIIDNRGESKWKMLRIQICSSIMIDVTERIVSTCNDSF